MNFKEMGHSSCQNQVSFTKGYFQPLEQFRFAQMPPERYTK